LVFQEHNRTLDFNSSWFRGGGWKVALVVRNGYLGTAALHGRREHVTILWMIAHSVDERFAETEKGIPGRAPKF